MAAVVRDSTQAYNASATNLSCTTPTGAASGDILVACMNSDDPTGTFSGDGGGWTELRNSTYQGVAGAAMFYRQLSGAPAASYAFTNSSAANGFHLTLTAINPNGDTFSAATVSTFASIASGADSSNTALTGVADPTVAIFMSACDDNNTVATPPSGMTLEEFVDGGGSELAVYSQVNVGTGSITKTASWTTAGGEKAAVLAIFAFTAVAGPVIDSQPTAQTVVLNNDARTSATFECSAVDDITAAAWDLETSVGGGVYSEITDGGIYDIPVSTNPPLTTLVITPVNTDLSGRRVRARLTDAGGETTSNAVALTVYNGVILSATSAVTNASGVATITYTTDLPVTTNGAFNKFTATSGSAVSRTSGRPT